MTPALDSPLPFLGIHNIRIPVHDIAVQTAWYERVFGFEIESEFIESGVHTGNSLLHPENGARLILFRDPTRAAAMHGFEPIAFAVSTRTELERWPPYLDRVGVKHFGAAYVGHLGYCLKAIEDAEGTGIRIYTEEPPPGGVDRGGWPDGEADHSAS
jgi:catechol-2,3-dioxygenase